MLQPRTQEPHQVEEEAVPKGGMLCWRVCEFAQLDASRMREGCDEREIIIGIAIVLEIPLHEAFDTCVEGRTVDGLAR